MSPYANLKVAHGVNLLNLDDDRDFFSGWFELIYVLFRHL